MLQQLRTASIFLILFLGVAVSLSGVAEANNAPNTVGSIPTQTVDMNTTTSTTMDLSTYFNDADGDVLTYTASSADTTIATVSVSSATLTITPVAPGTVTITLTGTDPGGLSASHDFSLVVTKPNRAPVFSDLLPSTVDYPENATAAIVTLVATDPDWTPNVFPPPNDLTYSIVTDEEDGSLFSLGFFSPGLSFKTAPDYENPSDSDTNNTYVVKVKVTDPGDLSDTHTITITVTDTPPPAKPNAPTVQFVTESNASDMLVTFEESSSKVPITYYEVRYRAGTTGDYTVIRAPAGGVTSTVTMGFYVPLQAGVTYQVQVRVESGEGFSDWSDTTEAVMNSDNTNVPDPADALPAVSSELAATLAERVTMDRVIFNELRNASTDAHDWVELRNVTDTDINLNDWTLTLVTSESQQALTLPAETILPANSVILLRNTEGLILPQAPFTLILESPSGYADVAGNSFLGDATLANLAPLTADQAWYRLKPAVIGYRAEAWTPSSTVVGTPGQREIVLGDVNADGVVNILDLVLVASRIGGAYTPEADINGDGIVDVQDLVVIANAF